MRMCVALPASALALAACSQQAMRAAAHLQDRGALEFCAEPAGQVFGP